MKLVVGLGNPGRKYEGTRHNVGYLVLENLVRRFGNSGAKTSFQAEVVEADLNGERVLLVAPQTFMNRSGTSAVQARDFYKLTNQDILVVCDDFNLPLGKLRFRGSGSSGGQNGLADVIRALGDDVPRLRIGVGAPPQGWDPADYVLGKFSKEEQQEMEVAVVEAADAVVVWANQGPAVCMNKFNS